MSKRLVAYFSASGVTAKVVENLPDAIGADIFEIQPEVPYTKADLNWMDKKSRSTIEMSDSASRPVIAAKRDNMDEYDTIFVGFPIWSLVAPAFVWFPDILIGMPDNLIQAIAAVWLVVMSIFVPTVIERAIDGF